MSPIGDNTTVRALYFHRLAIDCIRCMPKAVRQELGEALRKLQYGANLGLPLSRPMSDAIAGTHELRLFSRDGAYRVFYYLKSRRGILVFHAFMKKTQKTPPHEIILAKKRLKEMLLDE